MFQCGGIALGIRILHSMGDGVSLLTFLQEWANTTRKPLNQPIYYPSFELASLFPGRELVGLKPEQSSNTVANKKLVTKSFLFDGVTIYALKAEATHPHLGRQPSKVQVLTAYIWRTLIRIARAKHGHPRPSLVSFAMSLRGRIRFLIREKSYGTLVGHTTALFMAEESEIELGKLVSLLRNSIRKTGEDFAKARDGDEIYAMLIDYYNEIGGDRPREVDLCRFTSWCGFDCYDVDFGWGKPSWVATVSKFVELVFLLDNKCGDGIETSKTLDRLRFFDLCRSQSNSLAILHRSLSLEGFALAVLHRTRTRSILHQIDPFCSSSNRSVVHQIADPKSKIDLAFVDSGAQSTIISKSLLKSLWGLAYVDFSDDVHLTAALAKNKQMFLNKKLSIARSDPKQRRMRESVGRNTPMEHGEETGEQECSSGEVVEKPSNHPRRVLLGSARRT
ncbi:Vinorine synthase [Camellia lanceoleosa]|uniref:Vinorine synthase n=1 Tax=Camellia lanceoleosa TaxID=1840588 RepID=A0ACC0H073_9ERIC|nr:Vinorine synthase [Camellia lanceoleosa]